MSVELCPKCQSPMVERESRYGRFLGCTQYPKCRGTRKLAKVEIVKKPLPKIAKFSTYQEQFFDFVQNGQGNGCLVAVAGSGKSTTLVFALGYTPKGANVGYLAFNKHIADELKAYDLPANVHISTFHSLGFGNIRAAFGKTRVDNKKVYLIVNAIIKHSQGKEQDVIRDNMSAIIRLVSMCKATMRQPTTADLDVLSELYGIECNGDRNVVYETVNRTFNESLEMTQLIDFDDMIYFSASGMVPCKRFDFLFVDEAQDLNAAQVLVALKSVTETGRILTVGDPYQSIYGFRGADVRAIDNLVEATQAKTMPLSITYRLPRSHVDLVKQAVPEYPIEAWESAIEGTHETIEASQLVSVVQDGDMVLCRRNAPLVAYAFRLLKNGIKVVILGRDIASNLVTIIGKVQKKYNTGQSITTFLGSLREYRYETVAKLEKAGKSGQAQTLDDKCETIIALSDNCKSVQDILERIDSIFSDTQQGITFSSVHKIKGKEAKRVFLLKPQELGSTDRCKTQDDIDQERNIKIVAWSRSKSDLYFVEDNVQGSMF